MKPDHTALWAAVPEDRRWKYAHCERERRFLLSGDPGVPEIAAPTDILDKYLTGTNIRLRKAASGQIVEYKFQKKLRLRPGHTDQLWNSTIYISKAEYELFLPTPGIFLQKRRTFVAGDEGEKISIDRIEIAGDTFWIAEVEFDSEEAMNAYAFGLPYSQEITNVPGFSGAEFAARQAL